MGLIQLPGKPVLRIVIVCDDKGQATVETETISPFGATLKNQAHPALLAKIFAALAASSSEQVLQIIQRGLKGVDNGAATTDQNLS